MLDPQALKLYALVIFLTGALFFSQSVLLSGMLMIVGIILIAISWSIKPSKLTLSVRGLFDDNAITNQLKERFKTDEQFNTALTYVHSLNRDEFLTFCRIAVEVRLESDRIGLNEVARWYKLGIKGRRP